MARACRMQSDLESSREYGVQSLDVLAKSFLKAIEDALLWCSWVGMCRDEQRITGINSIHKIVWTMERRAIDRVVEPTRRPLPAVHLDHQRAMSQHVEVAVTAWGNNKNVPQLQIFVTNRLDDDSTLTSSAALLVLTMKSHRALRPAPVRAVKTADTAGHAPRGIAFHNAF